MRPPGGGSADGLPWDALYRRALAAGMEDAAFWRISPAALLRLTRGPHPGARKGRAKEGSSRRLGGLTDCP